MCSFREQVEDVEYFHAVGTQDLHKLVVLHLGAFHPQDIVEQEFGAVGRGKALQAQFWPVNEHFAEFSDL